MTRVLAAMLLALAALPVQAAPAPGLAGAQQLYRESHWAQARDHLRAAWPTLAEKERPAAAFLIGRSWTREAELYDAVHRFTVKAGLDYMAELRKAAVNKRSSWLPLFDAFYLLDAGRDAEAEKALAAAGRPTALPPAWKAVAQVRRGVALGHLKRAAEAGAAQSAGAKALPDAATELLYWRMLADPSQAASIPGAASSPTSARAKLAAAAVLYRAGRAADGQALAAGIDLDAVDVEEEPEKGKVLRFFDPLVVRVWTRLCWERAAAELQGVAGKGSGPEATLAAFYRGLSLSELGSSEAAAQVKGATDPAVLGELAEVQKIVVGTATWDQQPPTTAAARALWDQTRAHREGVLFWAELVRRGTAKPLEGPVASALRDAVRDLDPRGAGAVYGRWGFARLSLGAEPREVLEVLEAARDKSNKNKLEFNDPLLLLAICAARAEIQDYAQALETLFEMGKTLPGLRGLQWNLQGLYAARQKAGGEARIGQ